MSSIEYVTSFNDSEEFKRKTSCQISTTSIQIIALRLIACIKLINLQTVSVMPCSC